MSAPFVGPPQHGTGCAYSLDIDGALCGKTEWMHILVDCSWGVVALATCAEHGSVAYAAGNLLAEHTYGPACADALCWEVDGSAPNG